MASTPTESHQNISRFLQSTTSNLFSLFNPAIKTTTTAAVAPPPFSISTTSSIQIPLLLPPILSPSATSPPPSDDPLSANSSSQIKSMSPSGTSRSAAFPSSFKISGLSSKGNEGGPAFVGQVFSMCDVSGTGLMAVSTHIEIPFISKRTPEWIKNMFSIFKKGGNDGPVFRFFMDLGDAVSYVKRLNIPTGVVGACRLDLAYEHFKEKPHMFEFIPNKKQVKAAKNILKKIPHSGGVRNIDGVPVFTAQNLDIAIATSDGIKWYTPYFFDKTMLDNILEESVDQHFHSLIQIRHMQRRRDVIDDNVTAEVVEDNSDNMWEPPEVQEVLDEIGYPGVPLSVVSKAAEMQLLYAVDKVLLGNRWLRKATGIQPKFPYRVDSFQKRSAASFLRAELSSTVTNEQLDSDNNKLEECREEHTQVAQRQPSNNNLFRLPFGDWFSNLLLPKQQKRRSKPIRLSDTMEESITQLPLSPLLPKITMVGISTGDAGQVNKASLKKTMEDLTKELEEPGQNNTNHNSRNDLRHEDRDPLFVANVGV
ncbi:hypothetical protein ACHQM5_000399 [Ranunculus cassubicifolius]